MVKQDLIEHCPVRFFDAVSAGGLKNGQLGLVTAKKGLGKTSILVQFGIDALLHDKNLVHVSYDLPMLLHGMTMFLQKSAKRRI